jgi:hypothetical protein
MGAEVLSSPIEIEVGEAASTSCPPGELEAFGAIARAHSRCNAISQSHGDCSLDLTNREERYLIGLGVFMFKVKKLAP